MSHPSYRFSALRMLLLSMSAPAWFGVLPPKLHLVPKSPRPRKLPPTTERPPLVA